jgi:2-methylcitrate dehydratase PrpD
MVKRLHLGRASEAGVLAASLAADGFEGPRTVLEGEFGFQNSAPSCRPAEIDFVPGAMANSRATWITHTARIPRGKLGF